jgi:hypothetical protein
VSRRAAPCLALLLGALASAGCGPDAWYFASITSGPNPHTTFVAVWVSDSPVDDAQNLWVTLERVEVIGEHGTTTLSSARQRHDLLALTNGNRVEVGSADVPSGRVTAIRLVFATDPGANAIRIDGTDRPLAFASVGDATWTIPVEAALPEEESATFLVDVNARLAVRESGGLFAFAPEGGAVEGAQAAWLAGVVRDEASVPLALATVSAQVAGDEVASSRTDGDGRFLVGPLEPAPYHLVATAPGRAAASVGPVVAVAAPTGVGATLVLPASTPGAVEGVVPDPLPGLVVRAYGPLGFLAQAGVDPVSGGFTLPALPPGTIHLEVWRNGVRLPPEGTAVVTSGGTVQVLLAP